MSEAILRLLQPNILCNRKLRYGGAAIIIIVGWSFLLYTNYYSNAARTADMFCRESKVLEEHFGTITKVSHRWADSLYSPRFFHRVLGGSIEKYGFARFPLKVYGARGSGKITVYLEQGDRDEWSVYRVVIKSEGNEEEIPIADGQP